MGTTIPSDRSVLDELARYYNLKGYYGDKKLYKVEDLYGLYLNDQIINLKFEKQYRLNAHALRNEIEARHGKIFTKSPMKQLFESVRWYKPRPAFNENELNSIERKNIQFIDDYVKKKSWEGAK